MKNRYAKKIVVILMGMFLLVGNTFCVSAITEEDLEITSEAVYLIELKSNTVLYSIDENKKIYPASTTKLITAMVIMDNMELNQEITVHKVPEMGNESNMNLRAGEVLTVEEMLWGILVVSANDACYVMAEEISGSYEEFAKLMNEKAKELGANSSNFVSASGMHFSDHYTTASDLMLIMKGATEYDLLMEIMSSEKHTIEATNKSDARKMTNSNQLLSADSDDIIEIGGEEISLKVPYYVAGKTGYTTTSGFNLVNYAEQNGMEVIAVTIGGEESEDRFADSLGLLEYGFSNYQTILLKEADEDIEKVHVKRGSTLKIMAVTDGLYATIPKDMSVKEAWYEVVVYEDIEAPVAKGQQVGTVVTYAGDIKMGETPLLASRDVEVGGPWTAIGISDATFMIICVIAIMAILLFIILKLKAPKDRRRKRKKRRND